jgi:hypothetical protein
MGEIEAQSVGADQRTRLIDMVADDLFEGGVKQVGGGMVGAVALWRETSTAILTVSPVLSAPSSM